MAFFEARRRAHDLAMKVLFHTDEYLLGPPNCTLEAFKTPQLRQCPFDPASMTWEARIDGGLDGYVWKVKFGDQGPFALKVFWDTEPLSYDDMIYHPVQRECHNAALLQMIEACVAQSQATAAESPLLVNANPTTRNDAWANQQAFSEDGRHRQQQKFAQGSIETRTISKVPRMRQCHGWLSISGKTLRAAPRSMHPPFIRVDKIKRQMPFNKNYMAIVYEYVEDGENDHTAVGKVLEFLWLTGFSLTSSPLERNWKSGVLLDLSDVVSPRGFGWRPQNYGKRDVARVLRA
ncbi:hypothetical protein PT974_01411 [Cladobotryum mycophilum]|uniref:Uncharacterized protein n=1 Tax=Cladobotryum mycophilum TaxID=491253 RepID=A0ABR0T3V8_9HYPO